MTTRFSMLISLVFVVAFSTSVFGEGFNVDPAHDKLKKRSDNAGLALTQLVTTPDAEAPQSLLKMATCIAVIPQVIKGGLFGTAAYGRGLVSCRNGQSWSSPEFMALSGGSFGFQAGIDTTDLVLVFIRQTAMAQLTQADFTVGVTSSIAAGPIGRDLQAGVDYTLDSDAYSYSRAQGLFAGVAINGTVLKPDASANQLLYGESIAPQSILTSPGLNAPVETQGFMKSLMANVPTL